MTDQASARKFIRGDGMPLLLLAFVKLLIHIPAITRYGYFRDELYYLASTEHLAFGYVDHPPLSIVILAANRWLLGDSLPALRWLPAVSGAVMVFVTGLIARELGGGRRSQALAALAVIVAPIYLGVDHFYSMNAFDLLIWTVAAWLLIRCLATGSTRLWLLLGVTLGLGLLNKISVLWLGFGFGAGLLLAPCRRVVLTRGPWIAAGVAAVIFLPHIVWQIGNDWPTLEFMRNATEQKMTRIDLLEFAKNQVLAMNPVNAPIWLAGLAWLLFSRQGLPWRVLGWTYLSVLSILVVSGSSRANYLAPAYTTLLAAGALAVERLAGKNRLIVVATGLVLMGGGAALAPFALPVLPPQQFIGYMRTLGVRPPAEERSSQGELPQHYADMFGWDEMAEKVAAAYDSLEPEEQAHCIIFGQNYGEAGAIDVLGRRRGLPRASSGHNSYWLWGPSDPAAQVAIIIGGELEDNQAVFESLERVDTIRCELCMPYERELPVYIGRKPKVPPNALWPQLKRFI